MLKPLFIFIPQKLTVSDRLIIKLGGATNLVYAQAQYYPGMDCLASNLDRLPD